MSNPKLGLICSSHDYNTVGENNSLIETGDWRISRLKIETLMESDVFLTESSSKPAYVGGRIVGYRRKPSGKYVIYFESSSQYSGYDDHVETWSQSSTLGARNPVRYF